MLEEKRILFDEAQEAVKELYKLVPDETERKNQPTSLIHLVELFKTFLVNKSKIMLFLGAGTSMSVKVSDGAQLLNWNQLLEAIFEELQPGEKRTLLRELSIELDDEFKVESNEKKWFGNIMNKYDKPTIAWYLKHYAADQKLERNKIIAREFWNKTNEKKLESPLLEEIVKLPCEDIITTNFDDAIYRFLTEPAYGEPAKKSSISEIFDRKTFQNSIGHPKNKRIFYIHGKILNERTVSGLLVFDKIDFAKLIAEKDSLVEYLIAQIVTSSVIYIGFGLDDQTFNHIQARLQSILYYKEESYGNKIQPSFAFFQKKGDLEVKTFWEQFGIKIINFGDTYENLPKILKKINLILRYLGQEIEKNLNPVDLFDNDEKILKHISEYAKSGETFYVEGDFAKSLDYYRLALASTLFWDLDGEEDAIKRWEKFEKVIELRWHIALNHSKLRWSSESESHNNSAELAINNAFINLFTYVESCQNRKTSKRHQKEPGYIKTLRNYTEDCRAKIYNSENSPADSVSKTNYDKSLSQLKNYIKDNLDSLCEQRIRLDVEAQLLSLETLHSRIRLHEGRFDESISSYDETIKDAEKSESDWKIKSIEDIKKSKLLFNTSYYFAKCQFERSKYLSKEESIFNERTVQSLEENVNVYALGREFLEKNTNPDANLKLLIKELGNVLVINYLTVSIGLIRAFTDIIPLENEHSRDKIYSLSLGISMLEKALELGKTSLPHSNEKIMPSVRWEADIYRYLCRAYGLRWFISQTDNLVESEGFLEEENVVKILEILKQDKESLKENADGGKETDLANALNTIQTALSLTDSPTLKGQYVKNLYEAVKLNLLVIKSFQKYKGKFSSAELTPLSKATATYHLNKAFKINYSMFAPSKEGYPDKLLTEKNAHIVWILLGCFKMASYLNKVIEDSSKVKLLEDATLKKFSSLPVDKQCENVKDWFALYDKKILKKETKSFLNKYKNDYQKVFKNLDNGIPVTSTLPKMKMAKKQNKK